MPVDSDLTELALVVWIGAENDEALQKERSRNSLAGADRRLSPIGRRCLELLPDTASDQARMPARISRPGRSPVSWSSTTIAVPATSVVR